MAVRNKTYNNVINTLLRMGEYHKQISSTSVGDIWEINLEKMEKMPLLHVNPTSVVTGDSQLTYNFQIFICDLVSERENWTENNASANFSKLVKTLSNDINVPLYFTQDQFTLEPFQERFDNLLCGYVFQIGILVQNDFQTCEIPLGGNEGKGAGY